MTHAVRHSDELPPMELRRASMVFFDMRKQQHVMWAGRDWIEVEPDGETWRRMSTATRA